MRIHMPVGQRIPRLVGALGRSVAAHLDLTEDELRSEFDVLRWQNPPTFSKYIAQVQLAKDLGYGLDESNFAPGVTTAATAIADTYGAIAYGISGIMFTGQYDSDTVQAIARRLVAVSRAASARLV